MRRVADEDPEAMSQRIVFDLKLVALSSPNTLVK